MAIRIHDPAILNAQGALVDLNLIMKQQGIPQPPTVAVPKRRFLYLRWQTSPGVGLPTEPFKVWRRPALPLVQPHPVDFDEQGFFPFKILQFATPLASVRITVYSIAGGGVLVAPLIGPPIIEAIVGAQSRTLPANGSDTMEFEAPLITGLLVYNASSYDPPNGATVDELGKVEGWTLVETVGLPVEEGDWSALGQRHGVKQGLVGAELPAIDAAIQRYGRGVNPLGWRPAFPDATPAPAWLLPDPGKLVEECAIEVLPMLRGVAALRPDQQAARLFHFTIDPPQNPAGDVMPATNPGTADLSPIGLLAMAVSTDPPAAVALGYGTGYPDEDIPPINLGDRQLFGDSTHSDWDWLITGLWEKGLDGRSEPIEYAALVPRPGLALTAPASADFAVDQLASLRPASPDQDWLASIRASWERFPINQLASVASFAAARRRSGAPGAAEALLRKHDLAGGFHPIGNARNDRDPEPTRQSATDGALDVPNDPGSVAMTYASATQTIFGVWSPWVAASLVVGQPDPPPVPFLSADLHPTDPGSGSLCPATLTFEISVDWRVRSPQRIALRGRLFPAATRSSAPPAAPPPAGLQKSLGGPAAATQIVFAGDTPALVGGTVEALNPEGTAVVAPGAAQGMARRYRVTIPGFSLNYAGTPHIGLVLEARMVERIAPNHVGPWSPVPRVAYASDPRSVPTAVDIVQLASLPDAAGQCHVHLSWGAIAGAAGYAIYESTETRILTSHPGQPQPTPDRTLSQRLTTIKAAFQSDPLRRDFIRRNPDLLPAIAADVTMPRGSRDIHLYTILPVMAGGVEGPWPSGPNADDALIAYAAPKVAEPAPPTLEVQLVSDKAPAAPDYRARIRVGGRGSAGAHPKRIDLYRVRVDDAARALDSMGPPLARVAVSGGGWTVSPPGGVGDWIGSVAGDDRPSGSWRNIWYRAVAWSDDDPLRGVLKGRSRPSPAVSVVVPPAAPPDLSALSMSWPGGDPAAVLVSFSSAAPVAPTPLGPHLLSVEATSAGAAPLVRRQAGLDKIANAQPLTGSDVWRLPGDPAPYRLIVRRAAIGDAVSVIVRLTDPLGRVAERTLAIPGGSIVPLPTLSTLSAAKLSNTVKAYSFVTNAPDSDAAGAYRLHVELKPTSTGGGRGPVIVGPRPASQFKLIGGVHVFDAPIASVPTISGPPPATAGALAVIRQAAPARGHFAVVAGLALTSVLVRIVTPDGRTVEQRARG
jgi:hypothetical protein